ncbi:hypothetical protein OH77DRAFT_909093 [Trametes cingulata]|nr:hypothetical protein OH77DRAFT_909093 [Trametes cingulata]
MNERKRQGKCWGKRAEAAMEESLDHLRSVISREVKKNEAQLPEAAGSPPQAGTLQETSDPEQKKECDPSRGSLVPGMHDEAYSPNSGGDDHSSADNIEHASERPSASALIWCSVTEMRRALHPIRSWGYLLGEQEVGMHEVVGCDGPAGGHAPC